MPATNPLAPKSSYNNIKLEYLTPQTSKVIYVTNDASYPSSGQSYARFDGAANVFRVGEIREYTSDLGVKVESVFMKDGSARLENGAYLKGVNHTLSSEIDILKINGSSKLEFNSTLDVNWETYTPTLTPGGSMTYAGTSVKWGNSSANWLFFRMGDMVLFKGFATGTIGGTPSTYFDVTLPVNGADSDQYVDVLTFENGGSPAAGYAYMTSVSNLRVFKAGAATWTAAANSGFIITGAWYRAA